MMKPISEIRRENLNKIRQAYKRQARLAEDLGIASTYLNQMLHGKRGIGEETARKIEAYTHKPKFWLDQIHDINEQQGTYQIEQPIDNNYINFQLLDIQASAGNGAMSEDYPEIVKQLNVMESWAASALGGNLARIKLITARGTSMQGSIENGDVLFVDSTITTYDGEGIYVISRGSDVQVKRLQKLHNNVLAIISDNKLFEPEKLNEDEAAEVRVCGRVLAAWSLKKFW